MTSLPLRAVLIVAVVGAIGFAQTHQSNKPIFSLDDGSMAPDPAVAKIAATGFDTLASTWYWMKAVQFVGGAKSPTGLSRQIGDLIDLTTTLDPYVGHPYRFAAVWMIDDEQSVRYANRILRRAIEYHPDDWRNYFFLAFNHFFYLGENEAAANVLEPAMAIPNAPPYLPPLIARLRNQDGSLDAAAAFLHEVIEATPEGQLREAYEDSLLEIEAERRARFLDEARARYVERHHRDIGRVEDLVEVRPPILRALPPEPNGEHWELDDMNRIVSSHYRFRYEVKIDGTNRKLIEQFRRRSEERRQRERQQERGTHDDA